jgi:hypothetical protein
MPVSSARYIVLLFISVMGLWLQCGAVRADSDHALILAYEVRIGNLAALGIKYDTQLSASKYRSRVSIQTTGVISLFSDYQMDMVAWGAFVGEKVKPLSFTSSSKKNKGWKKVGASWPATGPPKRDGTADGDPRTQAEIDDALTSAVADPLTAVLRIGAASTHNPCETTQRAYSGRDVFDLVFQFEKEITVDSNFEGAYRGRAYQCRMTYMPVAGPLAAKFRKRKAEPLEFRVWFAPISSEIVGRSVLLPVFAIGKLDGEKCVALALSATIDGRPLAQLSPAPD